MIHLGEDNHRRVLAATLRSVDEALCFFEELASDGERHSVLYHRVNRLGPGERQRVIEISSKARELIREMTSRLQLSATTDDVGSEIWGRCFVLKEALAELEGGRLDAYGVQPREFREYVQPMITRLQGYVDSILTVAGSARREVRSGLPTGGGDCV